MIAIRLRKDLERRWYGLRRREDLDDLSERSDLNERATEQASMSAETSETYHCEVTVPEFFNRTYQKIIVGFQLTFIHVVHIFRPSKDQLMKTSRFFNAFLPAIVQLSALELTRMISLLFYPQKGGFIPPPPAVASWFSPGRRLYYRFLP